VVRAEAPPASIAPAKWSPPVIALLVDPWAKAQVAAPLARPRWIPQTSEIIDPWAEAPASPRFAAAPATGARSTIF
jgi:hypothetical protein